MAQFSGAYGLGQSCLHGPELFIRGVREGNDVQRIHVETPFCLLASACFCASAQKKCTSLRSHLPRQHVLRPNKKQWLLVVASRHSLREPVVAHKAALATLQFALLWALALSGLFLLWLAGARILLELDRALVVSGVVASTFFCIVAVSLLLGC